MFKYLSFHTWNLYFYSDCPRTFFCLVILVQLCSGWSESQTAELLWEKRYQTLKVNYTFLEML